MRQAIPLGLLGAALFYWSIWLGGDGLWLLWLGVDFLIISLAYLAGAHRIFGKRRDGTLPFWSWVLFLPYHGLNAIVWGAARLISKEPAFNVVDESLIVSRRLLGTELDGVYANYVDLTAEFQEPRAARALQGYFSVPILDASAPPIGTLRSAVQSLKPGITLVHCAQGHGRTGLFALAFLLVNGRIETISEGLAVLQKARPAIRLNGRQIKCAEAFERQIKARRA